MPVLYEVANPAPKEFTHQVFNETTGDAVEKYKSAGDAEKAADQLNKYHNQNHFKVRSNKDAEKEIEEGRGSAHTNVAVGDGTQVHLTPEDSINNETLKHSDQPRVKPSGKDGVSGPLVPIKENDSPKDNKGNVIVPEAPKKTEVKPVA